MAKTRAELKQEFQRELYVAASFFKMKSLASGTPIEKTGEVMNAAHVDKEVNKSVREYHLRPFPHPEVDRQAIPAREPFPKLGKIARGEAVTKINKENDSK